MDIHLSRRELRSMAALEQNCAKQIFVINDIYSWEKELFSSQTGHHEGAALCSAVKILADETSLGIAATKRVLYSMAREWELVHEDIRTEKMALGCSRDAQAYIKGLEFQMSGNELWSKTTLRYKM